MSDTIIVGAGLAGLITACLVPDVEIYEAGERQQNHKALLRFRDESVSHATGIPFRAVRVHKSIFSEGEHHAACNPRLANLYAKKVTGRVAGDRSIWSLDTATRYIAPEDFYDQLCDKHGSRIKWQKRIAGIKRGATSKTISTAPLPVMMQACGLEFPKDTVNLSAAPIEVRRFRLPHGTNVYQTVYFPDMSTRLFRASITGDLLIVESMKEIQPAPFAVACESSDIIDVCDAFGLYEDELEEIDRVDQKYGKITDIPRTNREAILYELTRDYNVFSVGRFATWRNILLDDVVRDVAIVKRLMAASGYGRELVLANR